LLLGRALSGYYSEAGRWYRYSAKRIPQEITLQFLADGVNIEKSIPYHRLVTELFMIGIMVLDRDGTALPRASSERLHKACCYTEAYTRPDGLTPNVGDNDDARALLFDPMVLRDHGMLRSLGAVYFDDPSLLRPPDKITATALWLMGDAGLRRWKNMKSIEYNNPDVRYFEHGGIAIVHKSDNFVWMDVGEVGLLGRGGHGHNDLLSIELMLQGVLLVVDPGSYVYTANPEARNLFRSTSYHNSLRIDNQELAQMSGLWTIENQAIPRDVTVREEDRRVVIQAAHDGYLRLSDPVRHTRTLEMDMARETVMCDDHVDGQNWHQVERFVHVAPSVEIDLDASGAILAAGARHWRMDWDEMTTARIDSGWVSPGYGRRESASILVLTTETEGPAQLFFKMTPGQRTGP